MPRVRNIIHQMQDLLNIEPLQIKRYYLLNDAEYNALLKQHKNKPEYADALFKINNRASDIISKNMELRTKISFRIQKDISQDVILKNIKE